MKTKTYLSILILSVFLLLVLNARLFANPFNNKLRRMNKSSPRLQVFISTLRLRDIRLGPKNKILVVMEAIKGRLSQETLKGYSLRVRTSKSIYFINIYNLLQKNRVQFRGRQALCFTDISVPRNRFVEVILLKDKRIVSSLRKNLVIRNIAGSGLTKPTIKKGINKPNLSAINTLNDLPDLVVPAFTVLSSTPTYANSYAIYSVLVKVKNQGGGIVNKSFYVGFEYYDYNDNTWKHTNTYFVNNPVIRKNSEINFGAQFKIHRSILSHLGNNNLKVRVLADAPYGDEFPPRNGRILEVNENNNYSQEVIIPIQWHPEITSLYQNSIIKGEVLEIYGHDLLCHRNNCVIIMEDSTGRKLQVTPIHWLPESISLRIPQEVSTGQNHIYIALLANNNITRISNKKDVLVLERKEIQWSDVVDFFNLLIGGGISVKLHTRSGSSYNNVSKITILGNESPLNVPKIEFDKGLVHYRYLIDDMNSKEVFVDRTGCSANQLRLVVQFESQGTELKGFSQDLGRVGPWVDGGAPDIEVNKAKLIIFFQFEPTRNGNLDYRSAVNFKASINASNEVADWLMDLFMNGWENQIKRMVIVGVRSAINNPQIKHQITNGLESQIRFQLGIRRTQTITRWEFLNSGIRVTYY